jgi:hypothetical protein
MGSKHDHAISSCPDRGAARPFLHVLEPSADCGIRKGPQKRKEPMADIPVRRYPVRLQIINFETSSPERSLQISGK